MRPALIATLLSVLAVVPALAALGGDISQYYSSGTFSCCVSNGWDFVIVRSYCSYGGTDPNVVATLGQAVAGGITYHDVYHFPCYGGVGAAAQVQADYNNVAGKFGMMWFDIETNPSPGCSWSSNTADNCNFLGQMISEGQALGIHMGIYSSVYEWGQVMGGCTVGADNGIPLWYANWDGSQSFSDFSSFGGWTSANIKQYADSVGICGINADADWY